MKKIVYREYGLVLHRRTKCATKCFSCLDFKEFCLNTVRVYVCVCARTSAAER